MYPRKNLPCDNRGGYRQFGWYDNNLNEEDRYYHLGQDRNCTAGDFVFSLLPGKVIFANLVKGFGSYDSRGGVVIIESTNKKTGEKVSILYGHLSDFNLQNKEIERGEIIGRIIKYEYLDKKIKRYIRADHLHWGVWLGGGMPEGLWGYSKELDPRWIDPEVFKLTVLDENGNCNYA